MADHAREVAFTRAFFQNLEQIEKKIRRRTAIRQMIERYDNNVVAAWQHLKPDEPTSGFMQLGENNLLHLSIEALMLEREWRDVFDREDRAEALWALTLFDITWNARVDDDLLLRE